MVLIVRRFNVSSFRVRCECHEGLGLKRLLRGVSGWRGVGAIDRFDKERMLC